MMSPNYTCLGTQTSLISTKKITKKNKHQHFEVACLNFNSHATTSHFININLNVLSV